MEDPSLEKKKKKILNPFKVMSGCELKGQKGPMDWRENGLSGRVGIKVCNILDNICTI